MLALIACFLFVQAGAQAGPPSHSILSDPDRFAEAHVNGLDAQLHLSDEQKAKLRPLFIAEGKELILILNDSSLREDQRQQKIQQLHEETAEKVGTFLTPSQLKQYSSPPRMTPPARQKKGPQQI
jgi:Spy/CpxP family protein refolding chaperone